MFLRALGFCQYDIIDFGECRFALNMDLGIVVLAGSADPRKWGSPNFKSPECRFCGNAARWDLNAAEYGKALIDLGFI